MSLARIVLQSRNRGGLEVAGFAYFFGLQDVASAVGNTDHHPATFLRLRNGFGVVVRSVQPPHRMTDLAGC